MRRLLLLVATLAFALRADAQISIPITGGGSAAPVCTVAELSGLTGPCASLTPRGGEIAVVTDAEGQSCTATGGGTDRRIPCAYNEVLSTWLPLWGYVNPATGTLDMNTLGIANALSFDFSAALTASCAGLTNDRLSLTAAGVVECVEDIQSGAATSISIAGLRTSLEAGDIIDVNPAEGGSTSQGLQEAINRCNSAAGLCVVQLRADTTYTLPVRSSWSSGGSDSAACAAETNGADNIWIRGYGPSSVVSLTDNAGTAATTLICVETGSSNIAISDFRLVRSETCTSGCNQANSSLITASQSVSDVTISDMQILSTQVETSDTSSASIYAVHIIGDTTTAPDTNPQRVVIRDNWIQSSGRGVQMIDCDGCQIVNNRVTSGGIAADATSPGSPALIALYEGVGTVITGNVVDMRRDGDTTVSWSSGILLHSDQTYSTAANINRGAVVSGNQIIGLRHATQLGIWMIGYSGASITGNTFQAGQCSASATRSCAVDDDCADLGGTCSTSASRGVYYEYAGGTNSFHNTGNLIASNVFDGFQDAGNGCPVVFDATGGTDANAQTKNLVTGNVFRLDSTTADGICGDAARIALNSISNNYVVGSATDCLAGTQSAGCQLLFSRTTEEVTAQELFASERFGIPHSNTVPGSCSTAGELYHDDDAADGQALFACKAGVFVLQSGAGDITAVGNCASGTCFQSEAQRLFLASPTGATGQMSPRAIADVDIPATVCRSDGTNCPASGGSAANTEQFITAGATSGLSAEKILTPGTAIDVAITGTDAGAATVSVDPTEFLSGFTIGNSTLSSVVLGLAPSGGFTQTIEATSAGFNIESQTSMILAVNPSVGTFTFTGQPGDAATVFPTSAIGSDEITPGGVSLSDLDLLAWTGSLVFGGGAAQTWRWNTGADPDPALDLLDGSVVWNEAGNDIDFRVESDTSINMLFVDAGTNRVGVGTGTPTVALDVAGAVAASLGVTVPAGQAFAVASGCSIDTDIDCPASSVAGGAVTLREDSDLGTSTWKIDLGATDLSGNFSITPGTNGKLTGSSLITDDTIGTGQIAADGVAASEIAASAVGTSEIADTTVAMTDLVVGAAPFIWYQKRTNSVAVAANCWQLATESSTGLLNTTCNTANTAMYALFNFRIVGIGMFIRVGATAPATTNGCDFGISINGSTVGTDTDWLDWGSTGLDAATERQYQTVSYDVTAGDRIEGILIDAGASQCPTGSGCSCGGAVDGVLYIMGALR